MALGKEGDSRFFTDNKKKGEMHELRMELHNTDRAIKVDAVKKVIASMTVGKDVSMLFTDVLNCVQTGNIELKKLVYLYLISTFHQTSLAEWKATPYLNYSHSHLVIVVPNLPMVCLQITPRHNPSLPCWPSIPLSRTPVTPIP